MKRIVGILLLLVFVVPFALADKKDDKKKDPLQRMVGDWQGSMKVRDRRMTLIVHLVMGTDGKLAATVDSPGQSLYGLPAEMVRTGHMPDRMNRGHS